MVMGEKYFGDSQWWTSGNQTNESSTQKRELPILNYGSK